ncbi:M48 family metallopeptidase [Tenuifilum sp.]|uniref:M48 family metallopeptidase n=1 Tax=Tenuifilum sp. TaxID=2760880 RepID=UPI002C8DF7A3|nr:SprT family zinc-dependent metalloprotease [Tenuifilum sp.]HQE54213.1 SprT family zinc-dependent metalloprotease [Tenuifilum sp.]HQG72029.1 SprT family zinc-dependent metalloprotease [Tenuifilum sp.]HQI88454.1 SprT family zinc-dependent metalloprotease [Tenuifilum sp.]
MNRTKQCTYPHIGTVTYTYRTRCKRITLRVKKDNSIHVTIPYLVKFSYAEDFVISKADWIQKKLKENAERAKPITEFKSRYHLVRLQAESGLSKCTVIKNGTDVLLLYPSTADPASYSIQSLAKKIIAEVLRAEAKYYLPQKLNELATRHNFTYGKVTIRNAKSRWGSCSGKNNISLSLRLMYLPEHLIDYVLLHELCHTKEKNHGPKFWQMLDSVCQGNSKMFSKELKKFPIPF